MIKLAIIGFGHWGPNYLRNLSYLGDHVSVVAISDINTKNLNRILRQQPALKLYNDYREMFLRETLDGVIIATPASTHYKIAKMCLLYDKHILIEKPLTLNVNNAEELIALAQKKKKILMVGHTFLYNSAVRKVKEYLQADTLGKLYYLQAIRTHLGLVRTDVNAAWDLATHDVSIFNYFLNQRPISVIACGEAFLKKGRIDAAFITLQYPRGIMGHIQASWIDSNKVRQVCIVGSKQRIVFDDLDSLEPVRIYDKGLSVERPINDFGEFKLLLRDGDIVSPKVEPKEPLTTVCEEYLRCIKNNVRPFTDGVDGLNVVRVMCAIERSLKKKGEMIRI